MIVIVTGGRGYRDRLHVYTTLEDLRPEVVLHGGQSGADTLADDWARANGVSCFANRPKWKKMGGHAGPHRNGVMLHRALAIYRAERWERCVLVAFPGDRGTMDCISQAESLGIEVIDQTEV